MIKPLKVAKTLYVEGGVLGIIQNINLISGAVIAREPYTNSADAGATYVRFTCTGNKLTVDDDGTGIVDASGTMSLVYATKRISKPYVDAKPGHFKLGALAAGLKMRSSDPDFRNPDYPYLIVLTQDAYGAAVQIDLYDDGYASAPIEEFRKGSGTKLVFTGKSSEHDTFRTPPYKLNKDIENETWLLRSLNGRLAETPDIQVSASLYSGANAHVYGLFKLLKKDGAVAYNGHVGDYPAKFFLLPVKGQLKFIKEKTDWNADRQTIGGMVFLQHGNELYEWLPRSVSVPVEELGFTEGGRKLVVFVDVTGTNFRPDSTRTRMENPHDSRPFPSDANRTAPKAITSALRDVADIAQVRSGERSVDRWAKSISRIFGDVFFKNRNGDLRRLKEADREETVNGEAGNEPGIPKGDGTGPYNGPYLPDPGNPMLRLGTEEMKSLVETKKSVRRARAVQRNGVPNVIFSPVNVPEETRALRVLQDDAGVVKIEINSGSPVFSRSLRAPDLSRLSANKLRDELCGQPCTWLTNQVLGVLFHHDGSTKGKDISYLLENVAGIVEALRNRKAVTAEA